MSTPARRADRLDTVEREGTRITEISFEIGNAARGRTFMDTSYEGDLMARAGRTHVASRESSAEYGEKPAGIRIGARQSPQNFTVDGRSVLRGCATECGSSV